MEDPQRSEHHTISHFIAFGIHSTGKATAFPGCYRKKLVYHLCPQKKKVICSMENRPVSVIRGP